MLFTLSRIQECMVRCPLVGEHFPGRLREGVGNYKLLLLYMFCFLFLRSIYFFATLFLSPFLFFFREKSQTSDSNLVLLVGTKMLNSSYRSRRIYTQKYNEGTFKIFLYFLHNQLIIFKDIQNLRQHYFKCFVELTFRFNYVMFNCVYLGFVSQNSS